MQQLFHHHLYIMRGYDSSSKATKQLLIEACCMITMANTHAAVAMALLLLIQFGLPARSKPVITDPICVDKPGSERCCPPSGPKKIVNFRAKPESSPLRVRRPAHALQPEEARKYERATALMRALPLNHPWNFIRQANVHCAYSGRKYSELGKPRSFVEIHNNWHFFTWHRAYLYFYERILGKLINDTSFALPFWNWDNPSAMNIPPIYQGNTSSLFNPTRFPVSLKFIDLGDCEMFDFLPKKRQCNLQVMHRQFIAGSKSSLLFFGSQYRDNDDIFSSSGGNIENSPHGSVHMSVGSDISDLSKAAKDPLFFAHHGNIDRLWTIWESFPGKKREIFTNKDFLDASFVFWDENMEVVRIRVRDIIDTRKLGYVYEKVPLQWMNIKTAVEEGEFVAMGEKNGNEAVRFPIVLGSQAIVNVARKVGKKGEILVVSDIALDGRDYVWFKVYIGRVRGGRVEAGCFIHMKRRANDKIPVVTKLQIEITQFIEDIKANDDDQVVVTLVPKVGGDKVTIGGVSIV